MDSNSDSQAAIFISLQFTEWVSVPDYNLPTHPPTATPTPVDADTKAARDDALISARITFWGKMAAQGFTVVLYIWSLVAPLLLSSLSRRRNSRETNVRK